MSDPVVITVAITGSTARRTDNPAVPVTPSQQIESTHAAYEAGASLVHIHVRNPDESPSSDPALFSRVQDGVRRHCPGMIVQFSTSGQGVDAASRGNIIALRPDMASLSTGSVNFPTGIHENPTSLVVDLATCMRTNGVRPEVELFDLSHIHGARHLVDAGLMDERPHLQLVMGIRNALPAEEHLLDLMVGELQRVLPHATWSAAGPGAHQARVMDWVLRRGGDGVRTGLEDNIRISRDRLAASNAELVRLAVDAATRHGRRPAKPAEARALLGLADP
jgi:3-keto-5-aminohexanoate cleavage enzyme